MEDEFIFQVLEIVTEIPKGKVASYKQIAILIGRPQNAILANRNKNARLVGKILSHASFYGQYPCHRVVNSMGRLVPHWHEQKDLLLQEGILFKENGCVDMKKCQWQTKKE